MSYEANKPTELTPRQRLIPPAGLCVSTKRELFADIDQASALEVSKRSLAESACVTCVQLSVCQEYGNIIASTLFEQGGSQASLMVGGEVITANAAHEQKRTLDNPALPFDLRELPANPGVALEMLRRGIRARLFRIRGPRPTGVPIITNAFMDRLSESDPELHRQATDNQRYDQDKITRGLNGMHKVLCQQADFVQFMAAKQEPHNDRKWEVRTARYDPAKFDHDRAMPITSQYLKETLELADMQFYHPDQLALAHGVAYYQKLTARYHDAPGSSISPSDFRSLVATNSYEPEARLIQYRTLLHLNRLLNPDGTESSARVAARMNKLVNPELETELLNKYRDNDYVPPGIVRKFSQASTNPEEVLDAISERVKRAVQIYGLEHQWLGVEDMVELAAIHSDATYVDALRTYIERHKILSESFADELSPSAVRRVARMSSEKAADRLRDLQLEEPTPGVPPSARARSLIDGHDTDRATNTYATKRIYQRFINRPAHRNTSVQPWAVGRIVTLYPKEKQDEAAEQLFTLTSYGVLTTALSPPEIFQDLTFNEQVYDALDPFQSTHVTFSPLLGSLQSAERLAVAAHYGLGKLIYGMDIAPERLADLCSIENWDEYVNGQLLPKCVQLVLNAEYENASAVTLCRLSEDTHVLNGGVSTRGDSRMPVLDTIIGGAEIRVDPNAIQPFDMLGAAAEAWLRQVVVARYRAEAGMAAPRVQSALADDVIEVVEVELGMMVRFTPSIRERANEMQRAALAYMLGIDVLLYGRDLREALSVSLGQEAIAEAASFALGKELPSDALVQVVDTQPLDVPETTIQSNELGPLPTPQSVLLQLMNNVFGIALSNDDIEPKRLSAIINEWTQLFSGRLEHANHRLDIEHARTEIYLAWQLLLGKDMQQAAQSVAVDPSTLVPRVAAGIELIGNQLQAVDRAKFKQTFKILDRTLHKRDAAVRLTEPVQSARDKSPTSLPLTPRPVADDPPADDSLIDLASVEQIGRNATRREESREYMRRYEAGLYAAELLKTISEADDDARQYINLRGASDIETLLAELREVRRDGQSAGEELIGKAVQLMYPMIIDWSSTQKAGVTLDFDDFRQMAYVGAHKALGMHDHESGSTYTSFAHRVAQQQMLEELVERGGVAIKIGRATTKLVSQLNDTANQLRAEGKAGNKAEVMEAMGISSERYEELRVHEAVSQIAALKDGDLSLVDAFAVAPGDASTEVMRQAAQDSLPTVLRKVFSKRAHQQSMTTDAWMDIITMRLGFEGEPVPVEETARILGLPIGTVKSRLKRALDILRDDPDFMEYLQDFASDLS